MIRGTRVGRWTEYPSIAAAACAVLCVSGHLLRLDDADASRRGFSSLSADHSCGLLSRTKPGPSDDITLRRINLSTAKSQCLH